MIQQNGKLNIYIIAYNENVQCRYYFMIISCNFVLCIAGTLNIHNMCVYIHVMLYSNVIDYVYMRLYVMIRVATVVWRRFAR